MFVISNLKFGICLVFSVSYLVFSASVAQAALIIQAPKYIGLNSGPAPLEVNRPRRLPIRKRIGLLTGLVGYWSLWQHKNRLLQDSFRGVDPAGLAPASLGDNTNMLLHTPRARIHKCIIKQKNPSFQGILLRHPTLAHDV